MFRFICIVIFLILFLILTIPILIVEWIIGKFAPNARDIKFFAHRTMGIQSDFKNNRSKNDGHRRGKHSRRSGSLCRKSSKLLRHSPDIQPMQTSHRICRKKRNGEISDTYNVDASPVLSLP